MSRYIDADKLKQEFNTSGVVYTYGTQIISMVDNQPTADVRENVRGEWEHWGSPFSDESEVIDTIVCSVCGARFIEPKDETKGEYNYCPNCGAQMMRGEL